MELWQLLPLLVHAVLFGGSYVGRGRTGRPPLRQAEAPALDGRSE